MVKNEISNSTDYSSTLSFPYVLLMIIRTWTSQISVTSDSIFQVLLPS